MRARPLASCRLSARETDPNLHRIPGIPKLHRLAFFRGAKGAVASALLDRLKSKLAVKKH